LKAILLCAGFGTRLYPLTRDRPKPLLPVAEKPIVEYLLDELESTGAIDSTTVVSNQRFYEQFEAWGRDRVTVLNDGAETNDTRLGAVRDLAFALEHTDTPEGAVVAAGDNLFRISFDAFFRDYAAQPRNLIMRTREPNLDKLRRTGVAEIDEDGRLRRLVEKPERPATEWACPAFYLLEKSALDKVRTFVQDNPQVDAIGGFIAWLCTKEPVHTHEMQGRRLDIGDRAGYSRAAAWLSEHH